MLSGPIPQSSASLDSSKDLSISQFPCKYPLGMQDRPSHYRAWGTDIINVFTKALSNGPEVFHKTLIIFGQYSTGIAGYLTNKIDLVIIIKPQKNVYPMLSRGCIFHAYLARAMLLSSCASSINMSARSRLSTPGIRESHNDGSPCDAHTNAKGD